YKVNAAKGVNAASEEVITAELVMRKPLLNSNQDPPVDLYHLEGSDKGDNKIDSLTKEPLDTLLMGDEVTSVYDDLECDMPITISFPTTDVIEEDFDINSPLGEYVVDFLMENEDVAGLPRHLVKQLFSHLVKNLSLTKGMSDEPLGDDSKPRSYDVTFSNPLFDFNDDSTLCYDNLIFDEEFEDISSLDPLESTLVIDESSLLVTITLQDKDWSYMDEEDENYAFVADEEEVLTEYALMAKSSLSSDNEVYDDSFCSKSCRKNMENLNNKIIKLNEELSDCETDLYNYKRCLSQVEARLVEFKNNEIKFCERIRVLERDLELRDNKIGNLRNELEEAKKEKESIDFKIGKI
ncbi:hypothetical protein Tco_0873119, partial [Tanacetum coccineum]